jgi:arsenite methyltransferase
MVQQPWRKLGEYDMDTKVKSAEVRNNVRDSYGQRARTLLDSRAEPRSSCCGGSSCCGQTGEESCGAGLYPAEELATLSEDVTEASWGCGDPVTLAELTPGEVVLDLGSGRGLDCLLAARRVGETGRVIGVDMTPEMLSLAWNNAAKAGVTNVDFRHGTIEALPVDSDSVDVVISNCVINLSPDKLATFQEIVRVLKPGARVSVSDIVLLEDLPPALKSDAALWASCVAGAMLEEEYLAAMRDAGLENVEVASRVIVDTAGYTDNAAVAEALDGMIASVRVVATKPADKCQFAIAPEVVAILRKEEPGEKVLAVLEKLLAQDSHLLKVNANERAITHRLGAYLQDSFADWNVDCEYNRIGDLSKKLANLYPCTSSDDTEERTVFPDIAIHRRGKKENYLVIELKKNSSTVDREVDHQKLKGYREELGYKYALFIELGVGDHAPEVKCIWV